MLIEKPWGSELIIEKNNNYMVKKLFMKKGHRCSLQYHEKKIETIFVLNGLIEIEMGEIGKELTTKLYEPGQYITLQHMTVHRMIAKEDSLYLEASTPELDDVIRISDDYNRK